ncbi:hypothetical protein BCR33DRAFT_367073 [Rhizoclosmatium globosum]|uniref:Uncharacterized protein n=1 Tax=Rhizoclosmatium globosum TaxID=329046 RepID=A0A1Y2C0R6_9FUNG|nr:hypothetical protein BCR33DRAFT_367073 [Rhizoclosmatium globosum]|eukprot:ORY40494.1 hypothetical protein BCR33DRAFT_367073 [Rhizoclosmatium globosum]
MNEGGLRRRAIFGEDSIASSGSGMSQDPQLQRQTHNHEQHQQLETATPPQLLRVKASQLVNIRWFLLGLLLLLAVLLVVV